MNTIQFYVSVAVMPAVTLAIVMIGVFLNNQRLNDVRDLLRAEIAKSHAQLEVKMAEVLLQVTKNHAEVLGRFRELDNRLDALQGSVDSLDGRVRRLEDSGLK